jgi:NAD-dependent dihydropyrimidine dehydrogenase PreA subunit
MRIVQWLNQVFVPAPVLLAVRPEADPAARWLPVIQQEQCTGCGLCIEACENHCLELVWDFATLVRPKDCAGDGGCVKACPEKIIQMAWVSADSRRPTIAGP